MKVLVSRTRAARRGAGGEASCIYCAAGWENRNPTRQRCCGWESEAKPSYNTMAYKPWCHETRTSLDNADSRAGTPRESPQDSGGQRDPRLQLPRRDRVSLGTNLVPVLVLKMKKKKKNPMLNTQLSRCLTSRM